MELVQDVCLAGTPAVNGICGSVDCVCTPELVVHETRIAVGGDDGNPGPPGYYRGEYTRGDVRYIQIAASPEESAVLGVPSEYATVVPEWMPSQVPQLS